MLYLEKQGSFVSSTDSNGFKIAEVCYVVLLKLFNQFRGIIHLTFILKMILAGLLVWILFYCFNFNKRVHEWL